MQRYWGHIVLLLLVIKLWLIDALVVLAKRDLLTGNTYLKWSLTITFEQDIFFYYGYILYISYYGYILYIFYYGYILYIFYYGYILSISYYGYILYLFFIMDTYYLFLIMDTYYLFLIMDTYLLNLKKVIFKDVHSYNGCLYTLIKCLLILCFPHR